MGDQNFIIRISAVPECDQTSLQSPSVKRCDVEADFSGGELISLGGIELPARADRRRGLALAGARAMTDTGRKTSCGHLLLELIKQRIQSLALRYEDLNDPPQLRPATLHITGTAASNEAPLRLAASSHQVEN